MDLPWDFVVFGVPVSVQSKNGRSKNRWKTKVSVAAQAAWPKDTPPLGDKLQIHFTYFHDAAPLDVDNMLKLIQDALCGIVYHDDDQITDVHGHIRDINGAYKIRGITTALAAGFSAGGPFVHVRVELPSDDEELP